MKPVIGVIPSFIETSIRDYYKLFRNYCDCIIERGGVPLIIPIVEKADVDIVLNIVDGLLLSGGSDVIPSFYGEKVMVNNLVVSEKRDEFEIFITRKALISDMPVFGICRGMQLLNVAAGGTLYQDISQCSISTLNHRVTGKEEKHGIHNVSLVKDKTLSKIFGTDYLKVNSVHHQAIDKLAAGFSVTALAEDGIIEGIENTNYHFAVGVQWHPERMVKVYEEQYKLFDLLIEKSVEARNSKGGKR